MFLRNWLILFVSVKLLDWGEDGFTTDAETAALRSSFKQEVAVWHKLGHPNITKVIFFFLFNFNEFIFYVD